MRNHPVHSSSAIYRSLHVPPLVSLQPDTDEKGEERMEDEGGPAEKEKRETRMTCNQGRCLTQLLRGHMHAHRFWQSPESSLLGTRADSTCYLEIDCGWGFLTTSQSLKTNGNGSSLCDGMNTVKTGKLHLAAADDNCCFCPAGDAPQGDGEELKQHPRNPPPRSVSPQPHPKK
ncbi:unnamed protein product [Pleuronectes platessa]|uniref:Uncharacterized protein n=1 Tax=Pleuronectes platessa TaxID=8262 RepID=A0A9N7W2G4_PLEPL|nr:unnamed protein product [Pleuronectes platessa]